MSWLENKTVRLVGRTLLRILYLARLGITVEEIGDTLLRFFEVMGGGLLLFFQTLWQLPRPPYRGQEVLRQSLVAGWQSLPLIAVVLGFLGMITVLELNFQLSRVIHSIEYVPGVASIMMFREFGPTVVACMLAAKVGAGFTAEIASMKNTEQIDALELLSVNPVHYLVVPRFVATLAMQVALSVIGVTVAFFSGFLISQASFNFQSYLTSVHHFVRVEDFLNLITKALLLGAVVPIVSCYYGFRAASGAKGVGEATTKAVVTSILVIIILDFTISVLADKLLGIVIQWAA
jgi:phospholipid/cholesterol/gamma-HCH transport system permease protein